MSTPESFLNGINPYYMSFAALVVVIVVAVVAAIYSPRSADKREHFETLSVRPPDWYLAPAYNPQEWLVPYAIESISKPTCSTINRGDPTMLNWNASAYRFWRQ